MNGQQRSGLIRGAVLAAALALAAAPAGAQILAVDGFESGDLSYSNPDFRWGESRNRSPEEQPQVTGAVAHSGSHSLKFTFAAQPKGEDSWSEQRFALTQALPEIYVQWYQLFPRGSEGLGPRWVHRSDTGSGNNKFIRVWAEEYNGATVKAGASLWPGTSGDSVIVPDFGTNGTVSPQPEVGKVVLDDRLRGRWVKFMVRFKVDDGGGNGCFEMWLDNEKVISTHNIKAYPAGGLGNYFRHGYFMGWANSGFDDTEVTYIDDVVIATEPIDAIAPKAPDWVSVSGP